MMNYIPSFLTRVLGYRVDPDTLIAYRTAIPSTVDLQINTRGDHYIAIIKRIEKERLQKNELLVTEAQTKDELVDMVNDLIFTYKNIPAVYRPYYKQILKPQGDVAPTNDLKLVKAA